MSTPGHSRPWAKRKGHRMAKTTTKAPAAKAPAKKAAPKAAAKPAAA
ncbi:MAG: glutathione S-transferase family protein, partial [Mesorhizobium sp.]